MNPNIHQITTLNPMSLEFFEWRVSLLPQPLTDWEREIISETRLFLDAPSDFIPPPLVYAAYQLPLSVVGSSEAEYQQSIEFIEDTGEDMLGYTKRNHLYLLSNYLKCKRKFQWYGEMFEMHDIDNGEATDVLFLCLGFIRSFVAKLGPWATMADTFTEDSLLNPKGEFVQDLLCEKVIQVKNPNDLDSVLYLLKHGYDGLIIVPDSKVLGVLKRNTVMDFPFMFIGEAMAMCREGRDLNEGGYEADDDEPEEYYEGIRKKIYP